jgi:cell division protein ZapA
MAQVNVVINQKSYRMACEEGQESHLENLAHKLDKYVTHLKGSFGEIGDQRLTVMAGIMVIDELEELQKRLKGLESEVEILRKTRDDALFKMDKTDSTVTAALSEMTSRLEVIVSKLSS